MERTDRDPDELISSLPDGVREDMAELDAEITEIMAGQERVLWEGVFWGGSEQQIIGYGAQVYVDSSHKEIDWFVAHQANLRILSQVAARLEMPPEKIVLNIERFGNTSSASIPIALDEAVRDGRIREGHTVLMCALGAGISWGSALVRM